MKTLSIRGYAGHRRCSPSTVHRAITSGRITLRKDGRIDPDVADRQWAANTDPARVHGRKGGAAGPTFSKARAERAHLSARLLQHELDAKLTKLIPVEVVAATAEFTIRVIEGTLGGIGARLVRDRGMAPHVGALVDAAATAAIAECAARLRAAAGAARRRPGPAMALIA